MTQHETAAQSGYGRAAQELAAVTAALVDEHDTVGTLTDLLARCVRTLRAEAAGLLLRDNDNGRLELLASTSHRAAELELHQLHSEQGPCIEASTTGHTVAAYGADRIETTWPELTAVFARNHLTGAHATPLRWHGTRLGALGVFFAHSPGAEQHAEVDTITQAFADIATLTIVHAGDVPLQQLIAQTRTALEERVVVERAKGVLAYTENVEMDAAFERLVELADQQRRPVTQVAARIVADAAGSARA